jgi:hypothetical protein
MKTNPLLRFAIALSCFVLGASPARAIGVTATWNDNTNDNAWETAGNWDTNPLVPNSAAFNVVIPIAAPCNLTNQYQIGSLNLSVNTANLNLKLGALLALTANLNNNGTILVNSTDPANANSILRFDTSVSISGTGSIQLDGAGDNRARLTGDGGQFTTTNGANHLIHGRGNLDFSGNLAVLVNNGVINADVNGGVLIAAFGNSNSSQNNGTMEATNGGIFFLRQGTIDQTGGGIILASGAGSSVQLSGTVVTGVLNTASSGVVQGIAATLGNNVTNSGTYETPANDSTVITGTALTDNGSMTVDANNSTFRFDADTAVSGSGAMILTNSATLNVNGHSVTNAANHTIKGNGTINMNGGTLTNNGIIAPGLSPGQLNVNGNLQLGSTSNLSFEIGGTGQGTTYDLLNKTDEGTLTLNGNLTVRLINNFVPANSDMFTIVTTQNILAGSFSNAPNGGRLNTADGGGSFKVTYNVLNDPVDSRNVVLSDFQPSASPTPCVNVQPRISVNVSPSQVSKGGHATFTVFINGTNTDPCGPITVRYAMSGTANQGTDYTLSGTPGEVTIPTSHQSATVTLHALKNSRKTTVKATMTLTKPARNAGYALAPPTSATVTLLP